MNFNLGNTSSSSLRAPGHLFSPLPSVSQTLTQSPSPATIVQDQSRFSKVSGLIGSIPGLLPLGSLPNLNPMPILRKLPDQILSGLERGWQALKDTFTFQFEEQGRLGTSREAQANCGPASAAMVLKQFGIVPPTMQQMRRAVGAPIGYGSNPFGFSTQQVITAVKRSASEKGRVLKAETKTLSTNVDSALNEMRRRLNAGEKLILLTSNIRSLSQGHYIVINEVRPDGSIVVDDPGRSDGENKVYSRAQLAKALSMRVYNYGMENCLLSFKA